MYVRTFLYVQVCVCFCPCVCVFASSIRAHGDEYDDDGAYAKCNKAKRVAANDGGIRDNTVVVRVVVALTLVPPTSSSFTHTIRCRHLVELMYTSECVVCTQRTLPLLQNVKHILPLETCAQYTRTSASLSSPSSSSWGQCDALLYSRNLLW